MATQITRTTSSKLSSLPIVDEQVIFLDDANEAYYDSNSTRHPITSNKIVSALPSTALANEGVLYTLVDGTTGEASAYLFDASGSTYRAIGGGTDTKVTQSPSTDNGLYEVLLSGSADNTEHTEGAKKSNKLTFNPYTGGLMNGNDGVANGRYSHAEGNQTTTYGEYSHAEGYKAITTGNYSHAEGQDTKAASDYSHAEGFQTSANGSSTHAEGKQTITYGNSSHAEGSTTSANGNYSHAEGLGTSANGNSSHAEGLGTSTSGNSSHAEGYKAITTGNYSHAEGYATVASNIASHAEGLSTTASGLYSHAEGVYTYAAGEGQHVSGKYNVPDTTSLLIVGNGTANNARSNALVVTADGNVESGTYNGVDVPELATKLSAETETVEGNPINFSTDFEQHSKQSIVTLEPIQDLHGYDKPWVGGAGKNKLETILADIKTANTDGTWSGNAYTLNGVTFTVETDTDGNIVGIKVNGTASQETIFNVGLTPATGTFVMNGCPNGGSVSTYSVYAKNLYVHDYGTGANITASGTLITIAIVIRNGYVASNLMFYPMVRLSTETDATFHPYTNECGISGRTEIGILGCGANTWDEEWEVGGIDIDGSKSVASNRIRSKNYVPCLPNTTYYFKQGNQPSTNWSYFAFYDENKNFISPRQTVYGAVTTPENARYLRFNTNNNYGETYNNDISLNYPSTDHDYHVYQSSNDLTISLGQTVYGGTLDVENGTLMITHEIDSLASLNWATTNNGDMYTSGISKFATIVGDTYDVAKYFIFNCFNATSETDSRVDVGDSSLFYRHGPYTGYRLFIKSQFESTSAGIDAFKQLLTDYDAKICYELADEYKTTIQLTPNQILLLKDQNNISTDATTISVIYRKGILSLVTPATEEADGVMSALDKAKLDRFDEELLTDTSTIEGNPINFSTKSAQNAKSTILSLEPIQDLHGFDKPWVGGAGKNLLPLTLTKLQSDNIGGQWTNNVYVYNNVTWTVNMDNDGNITSIKAHGQASPSDSFLNVNDISSVLTAGVEVTYSGCPDNGSSSSYQCFIRGGGYDRGSGNRITPTQENIDNNYYWYRMIIISGYNAQNLIFYPMLRLSTVTDATFEPYTNICPISGRTEIGILGCGKNLFDKNSTGIESNKGLDRNTGETTSVSSWSVSDYICVNSNTTYYLTNSASSTAGIVFCYYDKNKNYLNLSDYKTGEPRNVTTPNSACYVRFEFRTSSIDTCQFEQGSSATEYSPYTKSNDLTIDLDQTVYGGTLDLESGELVVTHNRIAITSDISISKNSDGWNAYHPSYYFFFSPSGIIDHSNITCISNIMVGVTRGQIQNTNLIYACSVSGGGNEIDFTSDLDNTTDVKQFLIDNNAEFVYKLATPTTIQLTPHQLSLLKAQNNITTSQYTQIKVTYRNGVFATLEPVSENNDGLMSRLDKVKLDSIADDATKTEASTTNGNIKINGTETQVYDDSEIKGELTTDTTTIEGNPLNFTTLSAQTAKSTILSCEPIQDLHGYDQPWVGGASDQLLDESTGEAGTIDQTTGADVPSDAIKRSDYMPVNTANLFMSSTGGMRFFWYDASKNYLSNDAIPKNTSVSVPSSTAYFRVIGINSIWDNNIMINAGTTAKPYCPYTNICPISGRSEIGILGCGVNLWNPDDMTVGKWINGSGEITDNATGVTNTNYIKIDKTLGYLRFSKAGSQALNNFAVAFYDLNKNFISRALNEVSMAIPNNAEYIIYACGITDNPTIDKVKNAQLQLEYGQTATDYTPYQESNNLTISLGQTVYGGTLDVENGVLVVDRASVDLGDYNWVVEGTDITGKNRFKCSEIPNIKPVVDIYTIPNLISNKYIAVTASNTYRRTAEGIAVTIDGKIYCYMEEYSEYTDTQFKDAMSGVQLCYELATPITIQLTPHQISLLEGVNNISTTGDKITLTYRDGKVATLGDLKEVWDFINSFGIAEDTAF